MPHDGIVIKWEVASVVCCITYAPFLMCGQLQWMLLACRNAESYQAPGSSENDTEYENRSELPISFQVRKTITWIFDINELNSRIWRITNYIMNINTLCNNILITLTCFCTPVILHKKVWYKQLSVWKLQPLLFVNINRNTCIILYNIKFMQQLYTCISRCYSKV